MARKHQTPGLPYRVYGINLILQMLREPPVAATLHCPKGGVMCYGKVIASGDGFDEEAGAFREMPPLGAIVAFEEDRDTVEGHYFYLGDDEYRVVPIDIILMAFAEGEAKP